jgi:hypothetical protein
LKKVNLTKVRSATVSAKRVLSAALAAFALLLLWAGPAGAQPRVTIAIPPQPVGPEALARLPGVAPGLLSAGLGSVGPDQTYLDIGQGNRVWGSLYDGELPLVLPRGSRVPRWGAILERAESAPADIVPGLLASTLAAAGLRSPRGAAIEAAPGLSVPALLAADRRGRIGRLPRAGCRSRRCLPPVRVIEAPLARVGRLARRLRGDDLLIAFSRPPPRHERQLAIGVAGRGFGGNLTSDSTRLDGYVVSTDLAPTILERFGVDVPEEMTGEPIRSEGSRDAEAVASLEDRMAEIQPRRGPVIGVSLLLWVLAVGAGAAIAGRRGARLGLPLLALAVAYLPALLLVGAALRPSQAAEWLLVLAGAPALAAITLRALPGFRGLAVACAITVLAHALDVIAGSPLTALSLMGPNPGLGARFYGIGNELEAALTALALLGTGAAIFAFLPRLAPQPAAIGFAGVALTLALVFAAGRFGADVGAAIVFPIGGAVAAAVILGGRRRLVLLLGLAAPLVAVASLAAIDLVSGGDAHLTRSVLDAGGLHDIADIAERRLRLSARSFGRATLAPFLFLAVVAAGVGIWRREDVLRWLGGGYLRAGFLGAVAAVAVGTLVNDSGALMLWIGVAYLALFTGAAWAWRAERGSG